MDGRNKAAVLAIGTELTNGQITNRNASWISAQLLKHGIQVLHHRTIPDERELIESELQDLESKVDLIFVTGGLGPTTDDFTRDCVASWAQLPLIWDEKSWTHIRTRLEERKIPVREPQRQQCYFPKGANIIWNSLGTAHGFSFRLSNRGFSGQGLQVFVLPGPPREVAAVWAAGVESWLTETFKHLDRWIVKSWECFGQGESEVAHRAETALTGCTFEKGYRVHVPYVEFKLAFPQSKQSEATPWITKIEDAFGDLIVARDGADPAQEWARGLQKFDRVWVFDNVSAGYLFQRIAPFLAAEKVTDRLHFIHAKQPGASQDHPHPPYSNSSLVGNTPDVEFEGSSLILTLDEKPSHWAEIGFQCGPWALSRKKNTVCAPYFNLAMRERELHYFAESAILFWNSSLKAHY